MALMFFPSNISVAIDCQLHPYENTELHCMTCNLIQLGFSFLFVFLFGYIFWNFLSKLIDTINSPKVWMVTLPVPLIFTLLNILMQPREYGTMYVNRVYQIYLCYLFLAFFLLAVIFYMVAMELLRNAKNEERIRLFEMQESQYYAQQRYITETSRQRHDFRQQLLSMAHMAQNGEYAALTEYLFGYLSTTPESLSTYCANIPVNALLNYYAAFMDQEKIRRNWKISLPGELHITDTELCSLLGNLLENVCHGCQTLPADERFHCLTIQLQHGNCLYIVSSNSFDGIVKQKKCLLPPHTKGRLGHWSFFDCRRCGQISWNGAVFPHRQGIYHQYRAGKSCFIFLFVKALQKLHTAFEQIKSIQVNISAAVIPIISFLLYGHSHFQAFFYGLVRVVHRKCNMMNSLSVSIQVISPHRGRIIWLDQF